MGVGLNISRHRYAFAFFVEKVTGFFISVLAPIAKSGFKSEVRVGGLFRGSRRRGRFNRPPLKLGEDQATGGRL